jgi:putative NIF3 family GTP cyclohydrolase 1 type 2
VRASGDPSRPISRVAVCGGAGGSLVSAARRDGADVLLTADLRHHPALEEAVERVDGLALVDAAHWATEAPWLDVVARKLQERFGTSVDVRVSRIVTDPWTMHESSTPPRG